MGKTELVSSAAEDYLKAILQLEPPDGRRARARSRSASGVSQPSVTRDDEEARRGRSRRARALPRRDAHRAPAGASRSRCSATTGCSSSTSPTRSACRSTRCTPRPTGSSTCSPRSSRRGSTRRSATRRTTRTATRSRTPSCASTTAVRRSLVGGRPGRERDGRARPRPRRRAPALPRRARARARAPRSRSSRTAPFDGPVTLRSGTGEHAIARELAAAIAVA